MLSQLIEQSLVVAEPDADGVARYRLPEGLRRYGLERLAESDEAEEVNGRYADYRGAAAAGPARVA